MIRTRSGRALAFSALAAAVQACSGAERGPPPASRIVDRYVEAIGGRDAAKRLPTRHLTAEASIPETQTRVSMELWSSPPDRVLVRSVTNGMAISSGSDGTTAWSIVDGEPRLLDRAELEKVVGTLNFNNRIEFAEVFPTMETVGERTIGGHPCWNVRMVSAAGAEVHSCFDKDTGLLSGTVILGQTTQAGDSSVVLTSGWRDFDGLRLPTRMTVSAHGQQMVTVIKSVSHAPVADSMFVLPASVRALLH